MTSTHFTGGGDMVSRGRLVRDRNRLRFAWFERKQMCKFYDLLRVTQEAKIEALEEKIEKLEIALAKAVDNACEE